MGACTRAGGRQPTLKPRGKVHRGFLRRVRFGMSAQEAPTISPEVDKQLTGDEEVDSMSRGGAQEAEPMSATKAARDLLGNVVGAGAKEQAVYSVSLQYNKMLSIGSGLFQQGGRPWWTPLKIPGSNLTIVLGALPLMDEGHRETLTRATMSSNGFNKVTAVLTLNKAFELEPSVVATPVSPQDWKDVGVAQLHQTVEDFTKPSMQQFDQCCRFIDEHATESSTVYVHCKAGRGRSGAVVCCYLVHRGMGPDAALEYVKERRPHVSANAKQVAIISEFAQYRRTAVSAPAIRIPRPSPATKPPPAAEEPSCECYKQKPTLGTWPQRYIRIKDKSLLVYDSKKGYLEVAMLLDYTSDVSASHPAAPDSSAGSRGSSVPDLSGCTVTPGIEKFTFGGAYFKMSIQHADWQARGWHDPEAHFCFQAEYDRDRFVDAVTNLAAGRKWHESATGTQVAFLEPEPEM